MVDSGAPANQRGWSRTPFATAALAARADAGSDITIAVAPDRPADDIDARRLFLVPPCEFDDEGELTVAGVHQASALGDALVDVPLGAVYAGPGRAAEDTAASIAQRHGLVVRKKSTLGLEPAAAGRVVEAFEAIARAGSSRVSLLVIPAEAVRLILAHCAGASLAAGAVGAASITEIRLGERGSGYSVERLGDVAHLPPPAPAVT